MKTALISSLAAALLLVGCGESSSSSTPTTSLSGQLVDNYIENADYVCGEGTSGVTDANGAFTCQKGPIQFRLGGLKLGEITAVPADGQVFPQDLAGVARNVTNDPTVAAMARFLQTCDDDNLPSNGLRIRAEIKTALRTEQQFIVSDLDNYVQEINAEIDNDITLKDPADALAHLDATTEYVELISKLTKLPDNVKSALLTPAAAISQATKDTLAYMGNEERLAYDVYKYLYTYHLNNNSTALMQLNNIATNSESTHIQTVQLLVKKYIADVSEFSNIDLAELNYKDTLVGDMNAGTYDISAIQNLYTTLIAKGEQSAQAALEVGCMVEVTDINDLLADIETARADGATDIVAAFEFLRDGSYSHYWAFDGALKNMGVTEGCCSLGDAYCHPEYPNVPKGHGSH